MIVKNEVREEIVAEKVNKPLSPDLLQKINSYWRAANYLFIWYKMWLIGCLI